MLALLQGRVAALHKLAQILHLLVRLAHLDLSLQPQAQVGLVDQPNMAQQWTVAGAAGGSYAGACSTSENKFLLHPHVAPAKTNSRYQNIQSPVQNCLHPPVNIENKFQSQNSHDSFNRQTSKSNPHLINRKSVIFNVHRIHLPRRTNETWPLAIHTFTAGASQLSQETNRSGAMSTRVLCISKVPTQLLNLVGVVSVGAVREVGQCRHEFLSHLHLEFATANGANISH